MSSRVLPGLGLNGFWNRGEEWKAGGDENWLKLSVMTQLAVESATTSLPPSPANGVVYIVKTGDTNAGKVAVRDADDWVYFTPPVGAKAWVKDVGKTLRCTAGPSWVEDGSGGSGTTFAPVITETGASRTIGLSDAGAYIRFTGSGAKSVTFNATTTSFSANQEFHIANRSASGNLTISGVGAALSPPKSGSLVLAPGDTVTVKFFTISAADVFGSTEAA